MLSLPCWWGFFLVALPVFFTEYYSPSKSINPMLADVFAPHHFIYYENHLLLL